MSNNENLCVNKFGKICRTCLTEGEMTFLFETCPKKDCLVEMLMSITFVQFSETEVLPLPVQICLNCEAELKRAYKFSQKCREVDKKLRKCYLEFENNLKKNNSNSVSNSKITTEIKTEELEELPLKTEIEVDNRDNINPEFSEIKNEILPEKEKSYKTDDNLSENNDINNVHFTQDDSSESENNFSNSNIDDKSTKEKQPINKVKQKIPKTNVGPPYECKKCPEKFETYKLLRLHWKEAKHANVENCKICSKSVKSSYMTTHMRIHNGEKPYCCEFCQTKFSTKDQINRHRRIHTGERPYKCNVCEKGFSISSSLTEHMRVHTGEKPYVCNFCGKTTAVKRNLELHMRRHTGDKPYKCHVCERRFIQSGTLKIHLRTHTGIKPFICDYCGKTFISNQHLKQHVNSHATETPGAPIIPQHECKTCDRKFATKYFLSKHMLIHGRKSFLCNYCGRSFVTKDSLNTHIRVHTGEKPLTCQICHKSFSSYSNLRTHTFTHTGEKPHVCEICNRGFTQSQMLKKHLRTHSGEKPYSCDICGKNFSLKVNLKVHTRIHTGETPYLCPICNKGFRDSNGLKKHKKIHEKDTT